MKFPDKFRGYVGTGKDIVGKIGLPQLNIIKFIYKLVLKPAIHLKKIRFKKSFMNLIVSVYQRDVVKINGRVDQRTHRFLWSLVFWRDDWIKLRTVVKSRLYVYNTQRGVLSGNLVSMHSS